MSTKTHPTTSRSNVTIKELVSKISRAEEMDLDVSYEDNPHKRTPIEVVVGLACVRFTVFCFLKNCCILGHCCILGNDA